MSGFDLVRLSEPAALRDELARDVEAGLLEAPRTLPPKYFYDATGSELFEAITRLPEYYPTRAETEILEARAGELVRRHRPVEIFELGSGSSRKTRLLIEAMREAGTGDRYVALDVSEDAIRAAAARLTAAYPWLDVVGLVGDFHCDLDRVPAETPRAVAFLGSTIGNFEPEERRDFLRGIAKLLRPDDVFLLGVDLVKDAAVLEAAYDDAAGVTADFNRNLLRVLNRELDGDLPVEAFEHVARFDSHHSWIEMRLRATRAVTARLRALGVELHFDAGDDIRTEISTKFTRSSIEEELAGAGLTLDRWLTDGQQRFALAAATTV